MRKMLNTLFITSEDAYLALENENVVIFRGEEKMGQYPLQILENVVSFSYKGASPALMGACAQRNIHLCFLTPNGRFLARVCGQSRGNVLLRKTQYRVSDDPAKSCTVARNMIFGKIFNCRWVLERMLRDHAMRVDAPSLSTASAQLQDQLEGIRQIDDLDALRGIEGMASAAYFGVFDQLILNQKEVFHFDGRNRRPPLDRVNAALSMTYTLLAHDCASALESVGLDAYVGFMHRDRPGRTSLALDLMEELRAPLADRFVLTLINTRVLQQKHFKMQVDGAVWLTDDGRKALLSAWQNRKKEEITHPFLKEKMSWGLVPYVQALLLARHLRGDMDEYPPFFMEIRGKTMLVLITYDVNTTDAAGKRRLRNVAKLCIAHGQRVQNSVFECSLDAAQLCGLKAELTKLIDSQKDSLRFYNLGNAFHSKVEHIGVRSGYQPDDVLML